jgi:pimeloyl-ACP methyl ester carboxylesterase
VVYDQAQQGWLRMELRTIPTTLGPVSLWGSFAAFDAARPLVLAIRGAFPDPDFMSLLPEHLPEMDVVLSHLPGMHTPLLRVTSVQAFINAFQEVIGQEFGDREVIPYGFSLGGVVALGLRNPQIRLVIAMDPPLTTDLWPIFERVKQLPEPDASWASQIFGDESGKDYRWVLDGLTAPAYAILAGDALGAPRPITRLPGLVTERAKVALTSHPNVKLVYLPGVGHNIPVQAPSAVVGLLRLAIRETRQGSPTPT